ncbi:hypothetical protein QZH41_010503, partial [Actinostola sp. cb2023]
MAFFLVMERDLGVDHQELKRIKGIPTVLRAEDRLRQVLEPHYIQLLSNISRLEGGVKFIVDLRNDLSIIRYEAVHTMQGWNDLKRRLAPDRRCYVYTHRSMPREPIVVLHTALEYQISDNIQSILSEPEVDIDECEYELENRTTAVFYSISSTQKGLSGVDLGNFLIKHVVRELQHEFPNITQYATLSPIPGFRHWLLLCLNESIENEGSPDTSTSILLDDERAKLLQYHGDQHPSLVLKELIQRADWHQDIAIVECVKTPLMRLCASYLYEEKRRGFAMDPV